MSITKTASNITAPTQFLQLRNERYAYRRYGMATARPLLFLQHFTGTLDNWDPAVTDPLASGREVILFESAGVGRSTGKVPETVAGMAMHALAFLDGLEVKTCEVLGFSLGGMVAQLIAQDRPSIFRRMILVGTAPRGGEDIMHLEKPRLARYMGDPNLRGYAVLPKIFFPLTESSQAAGEAFIPTGDGHRGLFVRRHVAQQLAFEHPDMVSATDPARHRSAWWRRDFRRFIDYAWPFLNA